MGSRAEYAGGVGRELGRWGMRRGRRERPGEIAVIPVVGVVLLVIGEEVLCILGDIGCIAIEVVA
jgi:hypothetical protein